MTWQATPGRAHPFGRIPLYGPEFAANPAETYRMLREFGPVAPVELAPGVHASLVVGYNAALEVLRTPHTFPRNPMRWQEKMPPHCPVLPMMMYRPNCLFADGAARARYRAVITESLAKVDINMLRAYAEQAAERLIAQFGPKGEADLLAEYAMLAPLMLLFNHLCGCPPGLGDRIVASMRDVFDMINPEKANAELTQCMLELIALKRRRPGPDVPSWMMAHPAQLTDEEVLHQLVLLSAGTEPEQNLIANGIRLLLSDDRFAGDLSGGSLPVEEALDEILWTDPPLANLSPTYPVEDTDFAGVRLPAHEPVMISYAAANNDPALATRQRAGNRAHLAWGAGQHSCPAQQQARLMASVAVEKLLDSLPDLRLAVAAHELVWRPGPFHRALTALPVTFTPVTMPGSFDETPADPLWKVPYDGSFSSPPAVTSAPTRAGSPSEVPRQWWSAVVSWWRGL